MMRLPNPWVSIPILVGAVAGGVVGYLITDASCAPDPCVVTASLVAAVVAIVAGTGVGVVVILAFKSIAEWRDHADREILTVADDDGEPGPPTC